ncbi:trithorax histone-lysine N-methyltransferase [Raphidocelis subcapitata]|uniref:Trithorax histone-lysine N-methyltransferase n=1 Tax=Raphidocelis subcapitata TaxID=307507 RepID=A0A2V0PLY6_9CHLO|nr:trithorax histone-lysine N-methyltransferase [Raphidocelis subcapitata]|eukprot:GBF98055.1 trithorax histone-lysine N-methyltransferase [Raphidocelis subcapitata]
MLAAGQRQASCRGSRSIVAGTAHSRGAPLPPRRAPCGGGGSASPGGEAAVGRGARHVARATLDEPELRTLVVKLRKETPPPPGKRPMLDACIAKIDEINSGDPKTVPGDSGRPEPFRLAYSKWLTKWVLKLDPQACDELLILARGKNIESWKLAEIKRDDYAPNTGGQKGWEFDRKRWLAGRLTDVMKDAGYEGAALTLVEDVMMGRNVPNPRDMRLHDLVGPFGLKNNGLLLAACIMQTLADAEALLFLDRNFEEAFDRMPANEVEALARRELGALSEEAVVAAMRMKKWSPVQEKLLARALPKPFRFTDILRATEGVAASSLHPGDHRYANFDYE